MNITSVKQGSKEWLEHRTKTLNASDIPVVMGLSSYKKRDDLLQERSTGLAVEVGAEIQELFAKGHASESMAREIIESELETELFPITATVEVSGITLGASFDGIDFEETFCFEHKLINKKLSSLTSIEDLDKQYKVQMTQQMMVAGCDKCLFVASDGTKENRVKFWYNYDESLAKEIINHWKQFAEDLKNWKPVEVAEELKVSDIEQLPALNVQINGSVTKSNLVAYKNTALQFIAAINTDLQTDQDFADADAMVKFCGKTEKELDSVKRQALAQTSDIDDLFSTIDTLKAEMRSKRLELDKLVKSRKQRIKEEIVHGGNASFAEHITNLDKRLKGVVRIPTISTNFTGAIKNKRTIESLHNAVNGELARCKIEANEVCDRIDANIQALHKIAPDHRFLFNDLQDTCTKANDDFTAMVKLRVSAHEELELRKLEAERERIREEEQAKAEAKAQEESAERERAAREEERANMVKKNAERAASVPNWYTCETCGNRVKDGDTCPCSKPAGPDLDDLEFCDMNEQPTLTEELSTWFDDWSISEGAKYELQNILKKHMHGFHA